MTETLKGMKDSIVYIGDFLKQFTTYITNPMILLRDTVVIAMPFAKFLSLVICGTVILMAIFGNKKGLKHIPTTMVIYLVLNILVKIL